MQLVCYIIDDMATEAVLEAKPPGFKDRLRVQKTLLDFFRQRMLSDESVKEEIESEARLYQSGNMLRLRRIYQTPTVTIVAPLQREETHRVVRKYKKYKDFFFRLNLVTDNIDKVHFGSTRMQEMLDFMIGVLASGVTIGDNQS